MTPEQKLTVDKKEFFEKIAALMEEYSVQSIDVDSRHQDYTEVIDGICFEFSWEHTDDFSEVIRNGGSTLVPRYTNAQEIQYVVEELQSQLDNL